MRSFTKIRISSLFLKDQLLIASNSFFTLHSFCVFLSLTKNIDLLMKIIIYKHNVFCKKKNQNEISSYRCYRYTPLADLLGVGIAIRIRNARIIRLLGC